ncbi:MAG TPA: response regulator transcription factor [Actinomycetes bacterium]|jgi:DNA-binding NarL/FixJ family response regulator
MNVTRVLVADDHPLYRDGLRTMLEATDDLVLAAEVQDGEEALAALAAHDVDVALLDVNMPGLNGIDTAARIAVESPEVAVLELTMFADDASVFAAAQAAERARHDHH